jgi:hypothetical protein
VVNHTVLYFLLSHHQNEHCRNIAPECNRPIYKMCNFLLGEAEERCGKSEDREMAFQRFLHKQRQLKALDVLAIVTRLAEYNRATVLELEE